MTIESVQIQALQHIIKCQDEIIDKNLEEKSDIVAVWRNECYRLSARNSVLENEVARLRFNMDDHIKSQIEIGMLDILKESDSRTLPKMNKVSARLSHLAMLIKKLERRYSGSSIKTTLKHANEYKCTGTQVDSHVLEGRKEYPIEIHALLKELKSLETEAKRIIINQ